jgi:hypothetical protein
MPVTFTTLSLIGQYLYTGFDKGEKWLKTTVIASFGRILEAN